MMNAEEKAAFEKMQQALKEHQKFLDDLAKQPLRHATVIRLLKKKVTISSGSYLLEVEKPSSFALKIGDTVLLDPQGGQILEAGEPVLSGEPVTITRLVDDKTAEVSVNGSGKLVFLGEFKLKEGDEVLLDSSARVVVYHIKHAKPRFAVTTETKITWDSIGGQEEAKRAMQEAVELPLKSPEIFRAYNKKPAKGILLSGPPGCGKTLLGKAAATAISQLTNSKESGFLYIKGPEVLDPYVGVAEATVRKIFMRAKEHKIKTGSPAVVFIDEADAILGKRGTHHSFMEKTIVPAFLTEMDGMEETGALVILATNRPDTLDPAVIRDGRIDRKVRVERPTLEDSKNIFKLYFKQVPLAKGETISDLSEYAGDMLFHDERTLLHLTMRRGEDLNVPFSALVSGALIAGVVDKAASVALHRDIADGFKKASGITRRDVLMAIHTAHKDNLDVDHGDIVSEKTHGREVVHVRKGIPELLIAAE